MIRTLAILAGLALVFGPTAQAQQRPVQVMARAEAQNDTLTILGADGRVVASYAPVNAKLTYVTIAPDETHVAALEHVKGPGSVPRPHIVVLSPHGVVVARSARAVRTYVWCCGGEQIAYIAGEPFERGVRPEGVYILDLKSGTEKLLPGLEAAYDMEWAPFDNSLYLRVPGPVTVVRYDLANRRIVPTRHRDIDFSPEGSHYLHFPELEDVVTRLYDARRDVDVALPTPSELGLVGEWRPHRSRIQWFFESGDRIEDLRIVGWAFDEGSILLFTHNRVTPLPSNQPARPSFATRDPIQHLLYDVRTRRVVGRIHGNLLPWATPRGALPIQAAGRIGATSKVP